MITLQTAITYTSFLTALLLFLSGIEFLALARSGQISNIWNAQVLERELIPWLARDKTFFMLSLLEIFFGAYAFTNPSTAVFVALFVVHLLICIRFRGTFNGGSDSMILVLLIGLIIATNANPEIAKWGMVYIAVQALYSYFRAGFVKIESKSWRAPQALSNFISLSPLPRARALAETMARAPKASRILVYAMIIFELGVPLVLFFPASLPLYLGVAMVFHLSNWFIFGLNRFFWAWLAAWPSVFFLASVM